MSQVRDSLASFGSITSIDTGSEAISPTASGIVANMRAKLQQVRQFGQQLASLKKLGLNNSSLQEILAAGPDAGGQIAAALLAQGQSAIGQVNQLERQYMAASTGVGRTAAESQFGMAASQARAIQQTNIEIKDQAIVINVGAGTSAADTAAIRRAVSSAVTQAVNDYAREQRRQNRTSRG
jgi:hypothetical protein